MVRTIESWLKLKNISDLLSSNDEHRLYSALVDNPETKIDNSFHVSRNSIKDSNDQQEKNEWQKTIASMLMFVRPLKVVKHQLPGELIISLTSYKKRFNTLHLTLASLTNQSIKPDRIILWLDENERDIVPISVRDMINFGVDIRFTTDIKSYKKIIPTLREFPKAFIVTADDDVFYWNTWLDELTSGWSKKNNVVVAHRVHRAIISDDGKFAQYVKWNLNYESNLNPDNLLFPTGIGGVLYPPGIFDEEVLNEESFMELCPFGDDIWLYWMYAMKGVKVRGTGKNRTLITWPSSQDDALWKENMLNGRNDFQIRNMIKKYGMPYTLSETSQYPAFIDGPKLLKYPQYNN
jgi:protein O-GlcNAc transferase